MLGREAGIDRGVGNQLRSLVGDGRQYRDGEGDLHDDQCRPRGAEPEACGAPELAQSSRQRAPRRLDRGDDAGNRRGQDRQAGDIDDRGERQPGFDPERQPARGRDAIVNLPHAEHREGEAQHGGARGKHEGFDEELRDDPPPARPERGADGEFAAARRRARVDEHRDVGAHEHQQQGDGRLEHVELPAREVADEEYAVLRGIGDDARPELRVRLREFGRGAQADG